MHWVKESTDETYKADLPQVMKAKVLHNLWIQERLRRLLLPLADPALGSQTQVKFLQAMEARSLSRIFLVLLE